MVVQSQVVKYFFHTIIPLMLGSAIYLFLRDKQEIAFSFMHFLSNVPQFSIAPDWLKYNLPDALWFYAFLSTIIFIWNGKISSQCLLWLSVATSLVVLSEIFQFLAVIPGTFDWKDLLAYTVAAIASTVHFRNMLKLIFAAKNLQP